MRITARIERILSGNLGDVKKNSADIYEMRFHFASGYRVYYAYENKKIVILLSGGDKSTQSRDIKKAVEYLNEYKETKNET